jgi:hypothetical protein
MIEEVKKKRDKVSILSGVYTDVSIIKNYLSQNNINLYMLLKNWDFNKNNLIPYRLLKDALLVRGFKIDPYIRDLIMNLALKFASKTDSDLDNFLINYESLCFEFV